MTKLKNKISSNIVDGNNLFAKVLDENEALLLKRCKEGIDETPEDPKNYEKIMKLKQQVESGTYDFDENLDKVAEALILESNSDVPITLSVFD